MCVLFGERGFIRGGGPLLEKWIYYVGWGGGGPLWEKWIYSVGVGVDLFGKSGFIRWGWGWGGGVDFFGKSGFIRWGGGVGGVDFFGKSGFIRWGGEWTSLGKVISPVLALRVFMTHILYFWTEKHFLIITLLCLFYFILLTKWTPVVRGGVQ